MSDPGSNGYHNGHAVPSEKGLALAASLMEDPYKQRSMMRAMVATLDDHGARGIPIKPELMEAFAIVCGRLMQSPVERVAAMAARALIAGAAYNLDRFVQADRMARLDTPGAPTERVEETRTITVEFDRGG